MLQDVPMNTREPLRDFLKHEDSPSLTCNQSELSRRVKQKER